MTPSQKKDDAQILSENARLLEELAKARVLIADYQRRAVGAEDEARALRHEITRLTETRNLPRRAARFLKRSLRKILGQN